MPNSASREFDAKSLFTMIKKGRTFLKCKKGKTVFAQGDRADAVFYILEGRFKISIFSAVGKEAVVTLLKAGDFFGEGCLVGQSRRHATAEALSDCAIMRLEKATMVQAIHDEPEFAELFMSYILAQIIRMEKDIADQLLNSSEKRLARRLLILASVGTDGHPEPIIPKVSQETLAEMVGTTRSRINRFMNKFRKLGYVSYNGHIEVHRSLMNVILHDAPFNADDSMLTKINNDDVPDGKFPEESLADAHDERSTSYQKKTPGGGPRLG